MDIKQTTSNCSASSEYYCPSCHYIPLSGFVQIGTFANKSRDEKKEICKCNGYSSSKEFLNANPGILRQIDFWEGCDGKINKFCYDSLKNIYQEIITYNNGYFRGIKLSSSWRANNSVSNSISNHCFGIAIDIQAGSEGNPYAEKATMKSFWKHFNGVSWQNIPPNTKLSRYGGIKLSPYNGTYDNKKCIWTNDHPIVEIFKKYGWGWGGTYGDTMHFSIDDGH